MTPTEEICDVLLRRHCLQGFSSDELWDEVSGFSDRLQFTHTLARMANAGELDRRKLGERDMRYWAKGKGPVNGDHAAPAKQPAAPVVRSYVTPTPSPARAAALQAAKPEAAQAPDAWRGRKKEATQAELFAKAATSFPGLTASQVGNRMEPPISSPTASAVASVAMQQALVSRARVADVWCYWPPGEAPANEAAAPAQPTAAAAVQAQQAHREQEYPKSAPSTVLLTAPAPPEGAIHLPLVTGKASAPLLATPPGSPPAMAGAYVIEDMPVKQIQSGLIGRLVAAMPKIPVGKSIVVVESTERGRDSAFSRAKRYLKEGKVEGEFKSFNEQNSTALRIGRIA